MLKEVFKYIYVLMFSIILIGIIWFGITDKKVVTQEVNELVIFGQNTDLDEKHKAFIEDGCIYVAFSTFYKTVDPDLFYDELTEKIIITNYDYVVKLKVGSNVISVNLEDKNIEHTAKKIDGVVFLPLSDLIDYYDITLSYNEESKIVSINKKDEKQDLIVNNFTNVYEDITTDSKVLETLKYNDTVVVYNEALKHNRWYKIRTNTGNVGYIFKTNVNFDASDETIESVENKIEEKEKYVMFWQYGTALEGMGTKIEGVNVASPTAYEVSNDVGNVTGKLSSSYVNKAHTFGYEVWPIITNGIDNANYSSTGTSTIMNSEVARENLIKNILNILERDNLDGINIDFEQMKEEDRNVFTQFIRELAPLVRAKGKVLSVDMYFVKYIDRKRIGEAADYVVLMGYDQNGAWSETSGSVASVAWVEEQITSLLNDSKIPSEKIILGVPFYTRLWTEKQGQSKPTTIIYTITQASNYIKQNGINVVYDEATRQNYFEYTKGSTTYKMWVEDVVSMKNRVDVVNKYDLAGISAWRKGFETSDIWSTIIENLE